MDELSVGTTSAPDLSIEASKCTSKDQHLLVIDLQNKLTFEPTLLGEGAHQSYSSCAGEDNS
jgi:hypothetical protein